MIFRTSLVAVCCSSASVRSRLRAASSVNSRTFSIAITAWSANVRRSPTWVSLKSPARWRATKITPTTWPSRTIGTPRQPRYRAMRAASFVS